MAVYVLKQEQPAPGDCRSNAGSLGQQCVTALLLQLANHCFVSLPQLPSIEIICYHLCTAVYSKQWICEQAVAHTYSCWRTSPVQLMALVDCCRVELVHASVCVLCLPFLSPSLSVAREVDCLLAFGGEANLCYNSSIFKTHTTFES